MKKWKFAAQVAAGDFDAVVPREGTLALDIRAIAGFYKELLVSVWIMGIGFFSLLLLISLWLASVAADTDSSPWMILAAGVTMSAGLIFQLVIEQKIPNQELLSLAGDKLETFQAKLEALAREMGLEGYQSFKNFDYHALRQLGLDHGAQIAEMIRESKEAGGWPGYMQLMLRNFHELLESLELAPDGGIAAYGRRAKELEAA